MCSSDLFLGRDGRAWTRHTRVTYPVDRPTVVVSLVVLRNAPMLDPLPIPTPAGPVVGSILPPGSKSITNRALVCAALALTNWLYGFFVLPERLQDQCSSVPNLS